MLMTPPFSYVLMLMRLVMFYLEIYKPARISLGVFSFIIILFEFINKNVRINNIV